MHSIWLMGVATLLLGGAAVRLHNDELSLLVHTARTCSGTFPHCSSGESCACHESTRCKQQARKSEGRAAGHCAAGGRRRRRRTWRDTGRPAWWQGAGGRCGRGRTARRRGARLSRLSCQPSKLSFRAMHSDREPSYFAATTGGHCLSTCTSTNDLQKCSGVMSDTCK